MSIFDKSFNEEFLEKFIIPYHYHSAMNNSLRFGVRDNQERIVICSNDYAHDLGFKNFNEAMFKRPDYDYERQVGTPEHFAIQMNHLNSTKRSFNYIYKNNSDNMLYTTLTEPVFNLGGEIIGKKEIDIKLKLVSHREIIEHHFKKFDLAVATNENMINNKIQLNEKEEMVLFMLIAGYTQNEIGDFLKVSRSYILKLISEQLCIKFSLNIVSTKLLIDTAINLGYANMIPKKFWFCRKVEI